MKKRELKKVVYGLLVLPLIIGVLYSCGKDPVDPDPDPDPLEGLIVVHFDTDGGSEVPYVIIEEEGLFVEQPQCPTKDGFAFVAWYDDADLTTMFNFADTRIFETDTIYAKWRTSAENEALFNFTPETGKLGKLKDEYLGQIPSIIVPASIEGVAVDSVTDYFAFQDTFVSALLVQEPVKYVGKSSFEGAASLNVVKMANSVNKIGGNIFNGTGITKVELSDNLAAMGGGAFANCPNLTRLTLPNALTVIPPYAFFQSNLSDTIALGNAVTTISSNAFTDSQLPFINLPATVTEIGTGALARCVRTIIINNTDPEAITIGEFAFLNPDGITFKVPAEALDAYLASAKWEPFKESPYQIVSQ
jgi:uncharacterized repeat protein (TIGR02543 family)